MSDAVIVTDTGFAPDDWTSGVDGPETVELAPGDDPGVLAHRLDSLRLIRVQFPGFADGRGFTLARRLRSLGYAGRLRLAGPVIADQYAMARRSGFDEVEIPAALALRQPQDQWLARADWRAGDYQARLKG